jgi:uncharacterized glyoxalase superfamily protein PhnB
MAEERSVTAEVEVPVDPATAFTAFTEELDEWWVRGPINYFDSARAVGIRCEPGVGGRIVEVYDAATGDGLETARITEWRPGDRLAWRSSVDDVLTEIRFVPTETGTLVRVVATVPAGGADRGGTAWTRTVPKWFGRWCARRGTAVRPQPRVGRLGLTVHYAKPAAAMRWLATAFGLDTPDGLPAGPDPLPYGEHGHPWLELRAGNCSVIVAPLDGDLPETAPVTHVPWVYVDDLDAHLATARAAGATIVSGIEQHGYRGYTAADLEGHRWTFLQAPPG